MDPAKYEFQSDFAKKYIAIGRQEGKREGNLEGQLQGQLKGQADLLARLLTRRFGALPPDAAARIAAASSDELDAIGDRLLTAETLNEALGSR